MLFSKHYGDLKALSLCAYPLGVIGDMLAVVQDGLHGTRHYVPIGVPLLGVGNITEDGVNLSEVNQVTLEEHERLKPSQVQKGDLLVTITGRLGTAAVYDMDEPANLSAHVALCRAKPNHELLYLRHYLVSRFGSASLTTAQIGSTHPHINVRRLVELPIPLPPQKKQRELAAAMDAARAERRAKLARADALLGGLDALLLKHAGLSEPDSPKKVFAVRAGELVGTLNPERYRGVELEKHLPFKNHVDDVGEVLDARCSPEKEAPKELWDWIRIDDLPNQPWQVESVRTELGENIIGAFFEVQENDILIARLGPTILNAKFVLCPKLARRTVASSEFLVLRCNANWQPAAVLWMLRTKLYRNIMYLRSRGGTPSRFRLDGDDLAAIPFPALSKETQTAITLEVQRCHQASRRLRAEAEGSWEAAKRWFEEQLLGPSQP